MKSFSKNQIGGKEMQQDEKDQLELAKKVLQKALGHLSRLEQLQN